MKMAGEILWGSVFSATISVLSAVVTLLLLTRSTSEEYRYAKMWYILHIITASLAATYYSKVVNWQRVALLRQYHSNFLWLSRVLGVPLMAAHIAEACLGLRNASQALAGVGIAVFAAGCWSMRYREFLTDIANGLVLAVMAVLCCLHCTIAGILWVISFSISLYIGTHGSLIPVGKWKVARIDLCHWVVAFANTSLYCATPKLTS